MRLDPRSSIGVADRCVVVRVADHFQHRRRRHVVVPVFVHDARRRRAERAPRPIRRPCPCPLSSRRSRRTDPCGAGPRPWSGCPADACRPAPCSPLTFSSTSGRPSPSVSWTAVLKMIAPHARQLWGEGRLVVDFGGDFFAVAGAGIAAGHQRADVERRVRPAAVGGGIGGGGERVGRDLRSVEPQALRLVLRAAADDVRELGGAAGRGLEESAQRLRHRLARPLHVDAVVERRSRSAAATGRDRSRAAWRRRSAARACRRPIPAASPSACRCSTDRLSLTSRLLVMLPFESFWSGRNRSTSARNIVSV